MHNVSTPKFISSCMVLCTCSIISGHSQSDTLLLNNGDTITGDIQEINETTLAIKPAYAPLINIDKKAIKSFSTNQSRNWTIKKSAHDANTENNAVAELSAIPQHVLVNGENITIEELRLSSLATKPK